MNLEGVEIEWLGHAAIKVFGEKIIYIDPFQLKEAEKADIILVTHGHYDHCSIADIRQIAKNDTVVVATPDCQSKLSPDKTGVADVRIVCPGMKIDVYGIRIETIPAYNANKSFHQRMEEWVGYIINTKGKRIYHAGDTDLIPEMRNLKGIDIAFLPVGGTYTMTAKEASEAANTINPRVAVPMHYGSIVGSKADAETFKRLARVKVEIPG
jgi:L-ascorbate metabolism protein UlaG (beta-lactamase superfamily)